MNDEWRELFSLMMIPAAAVVVILGLIGMGFFIVSFTPKP